MKRLLILSLALVLSIGTTMAASKFKKVDSSEKDAPSWVGGVVSGSIVSSASSSDIEDVKQKVLLNIKRQIAEAVVSQVSSEFMQVDVEIEESGTMQSSSLTQSVVKSTTDKIPYLQAIALSKADAYYWEKWYDKKSGVTRYDYHVLYPFSDFELGSLIREFNDKQSALNAEIKSLASQLDTFTQVEDIAKNVSALRALLPEFVEGDPRITAISQLVNLYLAQYKNITVAEVTHQDKQILLQLQLSGRALTTSKLPTYKSNCADRINISFDEGAIYVTYDDYVCRAGDDNWIDFTFKFGTIFSTHKVHIIK